MAALQVRTRQNENHASIVWLYIMKRLLAVHVTSCNSQTDFAGIVYRLTKWSLKNDFSKKIFIIIIDCLEQPNQPNPHP